MASPKKLAAIQLGTMPTQYAVGWFTLALIHAGLAQGKGRSRLAWWADSLSRIVAALVMLFMEVAVLQGQTLAQPAATNGGPGLAVGMKAPAFKLLGLDGQGCPAACASPKDRSRMSAAQPSAAAKTLPEAEIAVIKER